MFIRYPYLQANPDTGGGAPSPTPSPTPAPSPSPTPAPTPAPTPTPSPSALSSAAPLDWLSDKYHVKGPDGKVDEAASIRKQAEAYAPLAKRMVDVGLPPEKPDGYKLESLPQGLDPAEFAKDPATGDFLKVAHAEGLTNKQVNAVVAHYLKFATEQGEAGAALTTESATTALKQVWTSDADFRQNTGAAWRASNSLASVAGVKYEDIEAAGLGNNPVFVRLMAALGKEMGEDVPPIDATQSGEGKTFEEQASSLRKELEALAMHDPKRKGVQERLDALYARKYGTAKVNLGVLAPKAK
jgi:hypothetical protein